MFETIEEMFDEIERARKVADSRVKPWQEKIKVGDYFVRIVECGSEVITIYGEVIKAKYREDRASYQQPHMKHFRLTRCYSVLCPYGELGDTHVSTILFLINSESFELAKYQRWPDLK